MKKILTLLTVTLFTLATMAADHYPSVTIRSKSKFQVVIDGKRYRGDNFIHIKRMRSGMHTIKVYEKSGFFGNRMHLVSTRNFFVRNNDLRMSVDYLGRVDIDEVRDRRDRRYNRNDRDRDRDRDYGRNDRRW